MNDDLFDDIMDASTTTSPVIEVVAVSCSKCGFAADIPDDDRPATTTRNNLHDNTWEHMGCGGQISFATRPERPMTLDRLGKLMDDLRAEIPLFSGFDGNVVDQLRVHYGGSKPGIMASDGQTTLRWDGETVRPM